MLVPHRVREAHPEAFKPKAMVLYPAIHKDSDQSDQWTYCFAFKAAAVYSAFNDGRDAGDINTAENYFKTLAKEWSEKIAAQEQQDKQKQAAPAATPPTAAPQRAQSLAHPIPKQAQAAKTINIPDMKPEDLPQNIKEICDAIYLAHGFLSDFKQCSGKDRDTVEAYMVSRHGSQLISDIAMLENQLPMPLLLNVAKLCGKPYNFTEILSVFCRYYSPFYASAPDLPTRFAELTTKATLLDCLHHSLQNPTTAASTTGDGVSWPIPPAKELARVGIRFEAVLTGFVNDVQFEGAALQLPALVFDSKTETVLRNLAALETAKPRRPVTRYLQLLYELVDDVGDVRVLKKCGALRGRWKRDEDAVRFVKEVGGFASFPSMYPAVDAHVGKMKAYYDERMGKFWVRNGPTLKLASSVAAAVSVVATAVYAVNRRRK
ncbi:hypothetical protein ACLOJK_010281 [Asimina triloba]